MQAFSEARRAGRRSRKTPDQALAEPEKAKDVWLLSPVGRRGRPCDAPYDIAYIYAYRGEADRAFEWLDKAAAAHDTSLILILVENLFATIHSDPRWVPFLRKLGKEPEKLAKIPFKVTLPAGAQAP